MRKKFTGDIILGLVFVITGAIVLVTGTINDWWKP